MQHPNRLAAPLAGRLPPGVAVRLLAAPTEGHDAQEDEESEALDEVERSRLAGFAHAERRRAFALGRTAARLALAERLGLAPAEVPLAVAPDGAPVVEGHPVCVSIAHAGRGAEAAAAAAVADGPVGVDLERIAPRHPGLVRRLLHPDEAAVWATVAVVEADAPVLLWTLKEALLKGLRTGFRRPAQSVRLTALDGDDAGGDAVAEVGEGPAWALRYERRGPFWLAVAYPEH